MGIFYPFVKDEEVRLIGVEAAGEGVDTDKHAATITKGVEGVIHGMRTYLLQDNIGNITPAHSISAGLDYPGVGPEHAHLYKSQRGEYLAITDTEALEGFQLLSRTEGIIPALESAHAVAQAVKTASQMKRDEVVIINLSGRGDKDIHTVAKYLEEGLDEEGKSNEDSK